MFDWQQDFFAAILQIKSFAETGLKYPRLRPYHSNDSTERLQSSTSLALWEICRNRFNPAQAAAGFCGDEFLALAPLSRTVHGTSVAIWTSSSPNISAAHCLPIKSGASCSVPLMSSKAKGTVSCMHKIIKVNHGRIVKGAHQSVSSMGTPRSSLKCNFQGCLSMVKAGN